MDTEIKSWLYDIQNAINEIDGYFIEKGKLFSSFQEDMKTKRAVERNLEIIGEAVSRIVKEEPSINISNSKKIIGTRNRIIHGYDNISDDMIWSIVVKHLPDLRAEVTKLLLQYQ